MRFTNVNKKKKPITGIKTPDKPGIALFALKRPDQPAANKKPVKDEVISSVPVDESSVIDSSLVSEKSNDSIASASLPVSDTDPLIGKLIEVTAPWGGKETVEIVSIYQSPSGEKWVQFKPCSHIKPGWTWEGGTIRASLASLKSLELVENPG